MDFVDPGELEMKNAHLIIFRPHCESMESPSSGTSSLLSYDRSSLKLDSNFQTVCGGPNSDSVSVSSAPGNNFVFQFFLLVRWC